jgi:predicted component of type VI protein secretion system
VEVREEPGTAGNYRVVMHLQPHFQLDELAASVRLTTAVKRAGK